MTIYPREFLLAIPKTDLHVHLDGSLRLSTLIELAQSQNIALPANTEEGLRKSVFKERYRDLVDYLQGFQYTVAVLQTPEALERAAYELCMDNFAEGVRYLEVRFAPQLHANASISADDAIRFVDRGMQRAGSEINARPEIASGKEPQFHYGIIGCAMRMFDSQSASYYRRLVEMHPHVPMDELQALASLDLVRSLIYARDEQRIPIAGFDLAGAERGYPAEQHREAYDLAHKHFIKKTVHAGEAYGPASIFQAITDCHADRIGHGTHLFNADMVELPTKAEREGYVQELWEYIADRRITIEVCLTSNMQTMPRINSIEKHPVKEMLARQLSITFCTDNRLISNTTVTNEIRLAVENFEIVPKVLKDLIVYGFKRSFYPADYKKKRAYVRSVIDYYEKLEKLYLGELKARS